MEWYNNRTQKTNMASLPTELIQSILRVADSETYHSARLVCHRWYHAASTASMIRKALEQIPMTTPTPLPPLTSLTERDWNILFNQVSRLNLLGHRRVRTQNERVESKQGSPQGCTFSTTTALSRDGTKMVALKGARLTVYDLHDPDKSTRAYDFALAQSLYPLWMNVCRALLDGGAGWGVNQGYAKHRLAVSSRGSLVAVGLGKTIQIYDYRDGKNINTPAEYVLGQTETVLASFGASASSPNYQETDGVVESLEFVDDEDDALLRVVIGKESNSNRSGRVRYLGDPLLLDGRHPDIDYWRQSLNQVYLDSVALATMLPNNGYRNVFKGLRLLPRSFLGTSTSSRSFVAALQTQDTQEYCIASISPSQAITITRRLPSKTTHLPNNKNNKPTSTSSFSSCPKTTPLNDHDQKAVTQTLHSASQARWSSIHLPSANTQKPLLSMSADGRFLVVYEPGAGHSYRFMACGALYVFCLEGYRPLSFYSSFSTDTNKGIGGEEVEVKIQPWSYLLDIVSVDVEALEVTKKKGDLYTVTALGGGQRVLEWCLG